MKLFLKGVFGGVLAAILATAVVSFAANIPQFTGPAGTNPTADLPPGIATLNQLIGAIDALVTPQSMATFNDPRNILDNGQMQVDQLGTGTRTCGTTTIPIQTAYAADRWGCNVNVTSGAGTLQVIATNLPAQPVFNAAMVFYRTSGALAQPQLVMQEIPTTRITPLQGQAVTCSAYVEGLANMLAETTTLTPYLFTGTGNDEGLQSFTASPAVSPAFAGIATQTGTWTITSTWARYSVTFNMPAAATEAAFGLGWTPTTGGTAGVTDGFRFTGVQCEQGATASNFAYLPYGTELQTALRYMYVLKEPLHAGLIVAGGGTAQGTSTTCTMAIPFPVTMRAEPTYTNALSATTFGLISASQSFTALSTPFSATLVANSVYAASINFTTTGMTAKDGCVLAATASGAGQMVWSANY